MAHPPFPFISSSPDNKETYVCGREAVSASGCFTYWCQSFDLSKGEDRLSEAEEKLLVRLGLDYSPWSPCYVEREKDEGGVVHAGGVALWGWEKGSAGDASLGGFWVRDYRLDKERNACGFNCTSYGKAVRLKDKPGCYHVRENWSTASRDDLASMDMKLIGGWRDAVYCMERAVAE